MAFQAQVAVYAAVHILAEEAASPLWDLPQPPVSFLCESHHEIDDIEIRTRDGHALVQAKRGLALSASAEAPFAKVIDQFVAEFIGPLSAGAEPHPQPRGADPAHVRFVLAIDPTSSSALRNDLPSVLQRIRDLPAMPLSDIYTSATERRALNVILRHIERASRERVGRAPTPHEINAILVLMRVETLAFGPAASGEREAKHLLREILQNADHADQAWMVLISMCLDFARRHSGAGRPELVQALQDRGILFRPARSYRDDVARLRAYSQTMLERLSDRACIFVGGSQLRITRPAVNELRRAAEAGSLVLVGMAGSGKSGVLHDLARGLMTNDRDVVLLVADYLSAGSLGELRDELQLDHDVVDVLRDWPGDEPGFVIIDALDAARGGPLAPTLRHLIRAVLELGSRWRVVVSIRKFDLRYSHELQQFFHAPSPSGVPQSLVDSEFAAIRHLNVPVLTDAELGQLPQTSALGNLLAAAPDALRELLRVAFNLRLAADLLAGGVPVAELTPVRTQIELLNRYWTRRVIRDDGLGDAREDVLRRICEHMVQSRRLRGNRDTVANASVPLTQLLSDHVLTEWQPTPDARPERYVLVFPHHVLFDYAVARLFFRGEVDRLLDRLGADPNLVLMIRPSLELHFQHLWFDRGVAAFWDAVFQVLEHPRITELTRLVGPSVAAEMAERPEDLEPLCVACESPDQRRREAANQALGHLVGTLT